MFKIIKKSRKELFGVLILLLLLFSWSGCVQEKSPKDDVTAGTPTKAGLNETKGPKISREDAVRIALNDSRVIEKIGNHTYNVSENGFGVLSGVEMYYVNVDLYNGRLFGTINVFITPDGQVETIGWEYPAPIPPGYPGYNISTSALFFPQQKEDVAMYMGAELFGELVIENGCLRVGDDLLVWPHGFSISNKNGVTYILNNNSQPAMRVGDKIRLGGGEIPDKHIAQYSAELPSARCPGPYWIVGEVLNPTAVYT